jgi:hypothetical protein
MTSQIAWPAAYMRRLGVWVKKADGREWCADPEASAEEPMQLPQMPGPSEATQPPAPPPPPAGPITPLPSLPPLHTR